MPTDDSSAVFVADEEGDSDAVVDADADADAVLDEEGEFHDAVADEVPLFEPRAPFWGPPSLPAPASWGRNVAVRVSLSAGGGGGSPPSATIATGDAETAATPRETATTRGMTLSTVKLKGIRHGLPARNVAVALKTEGGR